MEDKLTQDIEQSKVNEFKLVYGVLPDEASVLFRDGSSLTILLQHMYFEAMEELRDCDLSKDGPRIQGIAQTFWTLLNIPQAIKSVKD